LKYQKKRRISIEKREEKKDFKRNRGRTTRIPIKIRKEKKDSN